MLKKCLGLTLIIFSIHAAAAKNIDLHQAPLSALSHFQLQKIKKLAARGSLTTDNIVLQEVNYRQEDSGIHTRYQQFYRGLPVVGAQIVISEINNQKTLAGAESVQVNGHLLDDIQLNIKPSLTAQQALERAKQSWHHFNPYSSVHEEQSQLQIREKEAHSLMLVYLISFKSTDSTDKPSWPFFVIDAHTGDILAQWDNVKNFADSGPGGNELVHQYWYGRDNLPALEVVQNGTTCRMESTQVKLVNLYFAWDWGNRIMAPVHYECGNNQGDPINGAYSPGNDAYYFGHVIVAMYQDWYGVNALQDAQGLPMQLVMRVHFGRGYDNAFWDGTFMSFGDGSVFYPLVSLDITGHEVTHGFTEQHANLEYRGQPGSLNESMSDMAGQVVRSYLLEKIPQLYNRLYLTQNEVSWGIGETIMRNSGEKALRFMDWPSADGSSADCLDKEMAERNGGICRISYADVEEYANHLNPGSRESYIVHTGSGVFNRAFYLLSQNLGIKEAYRLMIIANSKYWNPTTDFIQGACGVVYAAHDLNVDHFMIRSVFNQVGVDTSNCVV